MSSKLEPSLEYKIKTMQAALNGEQIQFYDKNTQRWHDADPAWNWVEHQYRAKPEPKVAWCIFYKEIALQVFSIKESAKTWVSDRENDSHYTIIEMKEIIDE